MTAALLLLVTLRTGTSGAVSEARITEGGEDRITEDDEARITEGTTEE